MSVAALPHERYLVLGGSGFLGSYIVDALVARGEPHVFVFDLHEPPAYYKNARAGYFTGDICDADRVVGVLDETRATVIFHTIAPVHGSPDDVQHRVNIEGTRVILDACRDPAVGTVTKLVYTSSTGVVWNVRDFHGVSEDQVQPPERGYDSYHHAKAIAERMVLDANGKGLWTCAIRPCGMTGPRDQQLLHRLANVLAQGQHKVQIGDNTNLVDWVYAGNVADAHILAADRLPSSPHAESASSHPVAGQAFFITNGSPVCGWDFSRMVWRELGAPPEDFEAKNITKIPRFLALILATIAEFVCKLIGGKTEFTRFAVKYSTATQWYNIDKARVALGYEPKVSLDETVRLAVAWWAGHGAEEHAQSKDASRVKG